MTTEDRHRLDGALAVIGEDRELVTDADWLDLYAGSIDPARAGDATDGAVAGAVAAGVISADRAIEARAEGRVHWLLDLGREVFVVLVAGQPIAVVPYSAVAVANVCSPDVE